MNISQAKIYRINDDDVIVFKGVPHAAPPVGKLRWRAPQPPAGFPASFVADTFGNQCMQRPPNPIPLGKEKR